MKFCGKIAGKIAVLAFLIFMLAGCDQPVSDVHVHTYSENLSSDSTGHWYAATCEHSTEKKDFAEHVSSGPATKTQAEVCTVCGYEINPVVIIPKAAFSISDEHVLKMEIPDEVLSEYKKEGTQITVVLNINIEKTYIDNVVRKTILLSEFREKEEIDFSEILSWYDLYFALHENKYFVEIILCGSNGNKVKTLETLEKSSDGLDFTGLPKITLENNEIKISKFSEERLAKLKERGAVCQMHVLSMSKEDPAFKENTVPFGNWDKVWLYDKYFDDMDHLPESIKLADIIDYTHWKNVLNSNGDIFVDIRIRNKKEWDEDTVVYYWSGPQKLEWENWETEVDNILPFREVIDDYVGMKLKINEKFIPETAAKLIIKINNKEVYRVEKNTAKVHETEWLFPYVNAIAKGEAPYIVNILYFDENWIPLKNYTRCIYLKKQGLGNIEIISEPEVTISDAGKLKYTTLPELKIGNTVVKGDVIPENGVFKSVIYKNGEWYHSASWGSGYEWDRVSDNLSNEWDIAKTLIGASKKTDEEELSIDLLYLWKDESGYEYRYLLLDKGKYNFKIDWEKIINEGEKNEPEKQDAPVSQDALSGVVVFDPKTSYSISSEEIVEINGKTYLKITVNGYNVTRYISEIDLSKYSTFEAEMFGKEADSTLNYSIQLMDMRSSSIAILTMNNISDVPEIVSAGKMVENPYGSISETMKCRIIQFFVQEKTNYKAQDGVEVYLGKITAKK